MKIWCENYTRQVQNRAPVRYVLRFKGFRRSVDFHEIGCENGSGGAPGSSWAPPPVFNFSLKINTKCIDQQFCKRNEHLMRKWYPSGAQAISRGAPGSSWAPPPVIDFSLKMYTKCIDWLSCWLNGNLVRKSMHLKSIQNALINHLVNWMNIWCENGTQLLGTPPSLWFFNKNLYKMHG